MTQNAGPTLSCLVVARNEEAMLPDCLTSLSFADQLVVVLDRTTDSSKAIAEKAGALVIEGAWESEGARRNTGIDACTSDWILEVDADERATPEVEAEVRKTITEGPDGLYLIPIRNVISGREVKHGWGAYNGAASAPRLFSKGAKIWGPERVHPSLTTGPKRGSLKHGLIHLVDRDLSDMIDRMNRYTDLMARDAVDKNTVPTLGGALRRIFSRGWKSYVSRKGYKEGIYGIALAFFAASYSLLIHVKAKEILDRRARGQDV
ncbi:glycosyltransferase family 2 protein [Rhodospirillaceae bacterium KN72]|uniref:Glycosyltransferase family 2 protein n=1 Tax=Pacificispira spongiicola TaxID=2729598 RepID=A0A7Y0E259_9PROT|nr:glycosyltransferase family 2 protein [Pacificispira spongiicola]NMM45857.1 glycosyltransferase family 2 protein [Pacificispira spongiicola]